MNHSHAHVLHLIFVFPHLNHDEKNPTALYEAAAIQLVPIEVPIDIDRLFTWIELSGKGREGGSEYAIFYALGLCTSISVP